MNLSGLSTRQGLHVNVQGSLELCQVLLQPGDKQSIKSSHRLSFADGVV